MIRKFMGEYNHTMDAKGRLIVPAKFRDLLGDEFYVTRGLDCCLVAYTAEKWEQVMETLSEQLSIFQDDDRELNRHFIGGSVGVEIDKQGRVLIPGPHRRYAGLAKDVTLIGSGDYFEIWDTGAWEEHNGFGNIREIAQRRTGLKI